MKYLITGGSGFIGTNLIQKILQNKNNSVTVVDMRKPIFHQDMDSWVFKYFLEDISYRGNFREIFEGHDVVIHLACQPGVEASVEDPIGTFRQNVFGTLNCLETARKTNIKRFIFASSGGTVLGKQYVPLHEDLCPNPASPYGASKLAGEGYCKAYYKSYGLKTVILRFSNVYGPFSIHKRFNLIPGFIMSAIEDKLCFVNGDGTITKDYIFVDDLVDAILKAANARQIAGETFQIATGKQASINEIKDILNKLSEKHLSRPLTVVHRDERVGDVTYSCNISKANKILLFRPEYSLEDGLEKTFEWYIDNWGPKNE
jgi:UDP-glucose 4-epimerase